MEAGVMTSRFTKQRTADLSGRPTGIAFGSTSGSTSPNHDLDSASLAPASAIKPQAGPSAQGAEGSDDGRTDKRGSAPTRAPVVRPRPRARPDQTSMRRNST